MGAHTPGPWMLDVRQRFSCGIRVSDADGCLIYESRSWHDAAQKARADNEAEARLIAAAPDLLEALRDLYDAAEQPLDDPMADGQRWACYIRQARAAIAKAVQP